MQTVFHVLYIVLQAKPNGFGDFHGSGNTVLALCKTGKLVEALVAYNKGPDPAGCAVLVSALSNSQGSLDTCFEMYNKLLTSSFPNIRVFTSMANACNKLGQLERVVELWEDMCAHNILPNALIFGLLVRGSAKVGNMSLAKELAGTLLGTEVGNVVNILDCTQLVQVLGTSGKNVKTCLRILSFMNQRGIKLDQAAYVVFVQACSTHISALHHIKQHFIESKISWEPRLRTAFITAFGSAGSLADAVAVYKEDSDPNIVTTTAMLNAYTEHNCSEESINLFEFIVTKKWKADEKAVSSVLKAYGNLGRVDEAWKLFQSMKDKFGSDPSETQHTIMVDTFARWGYLQQAETLALSAPFNIISWTAVLSGCRQHLDVATAERAFQKIVEVEPKLAISYTLMANIYATANDQLKYKQTLHLMKTKKATWNCTYNSPWDGPHILPS